MHSLLFFFPVQNVTKALIFFLLFHADKVLKDGDGKENQNHQRPSARGTFLMFKDKEVLLMY